VKAVPEGDELALLKQQHPGRLVTLEFRDGTASQSDVFLELGRHGVPFELVYGGINDIQGRSFGLLTLELSGDAATVDAAVRAVGALVTVREAA